MSPANPRIPRFRGLRNRIWPEILPERRNGTRRPTN